MSSVIAKTSTGEIWKDANSGKIIRAKQISEEITTDGLICELRPSNIITVDGECSAWNDSVNSYNLIQNNAANRPIVEMNRTIFPCVRSNQTTDYMTFSSTLTFRTMMFVYQYIGKARFMYYNGAHNIGGILTNVPFMYFTVGIISNIIKMNNVAYTLNTTKAAGTYVVIAKFAANVSFSIQRLFNSQTNTGETDIINQYLHFAFYNKFTSDMEDTYNTNALKKRYNIA